MKKQYQLEVGMIEGEIEEMFNQPAELHAILEYNNRFRDEQRAAIYQKHNAQKVSELPESAKDELKINRRLGFPKWDTSKVNEKLVDMSNPHTRGKGIATVEIEQLCEIPAIFKHDNVEFYIDYEWQSIRFFGVEAFNRDFSFYGANSSMSQQEIAQLVQSEPINY